MAVVAVHKVAKLSSFSFLPWRRNQNYQGPTFKRRIYFQHGASLCLTDEKGGCYAGETLIRQGQCGEAVSAEGYGQHGVVSHRGGEDEKKDPAAVLPNGPIQQYLGPNSDLFEQNGPNLVLYCTSKYYLDVSNNNKKHGTK